MNISPQVGPRLHDLVRLCNRELAADATLKALTGVLFSCVTFGLVYWAGWFFGFFIARYLNLSAWQFGVVLAGLFLVVATWSAWRRVDPMAGLQRLSDRQLLLTLLSPASPGIAYFSPRHASAGVALILIGGPANVIQAYGIWAHRIRVEGSIIDDAVRVLAACQSGLPAEQVREPTAALLLRRLALIKIVPSGESAALALTDKGFAVLSGGKASKGKPASDQGTVTVKPRRDRGLGRR
jgi:hypothetical protein